jgi:hypothetical protein
LHRNCLLKYVFEGEMEGELTGRREKRREQLLDDLKEKRMLGFERGSSRSYCIELALEEAVDHLERRRTE